MEQERLEDSQAKMILPNYNDIFTTVERIRDTAKKESNATKIMYEHIPYKNIISILGERGSGKTTLFNSIIEKLSENQTKDVHLNLIVPEILEENADLLGVILLNIKEIIEHSREEINRFYRKKDKTKTQAHQTCILENYNEIDILWNDTFDTYLLRTERFNDVTKQQYSSLLDYSKSRQKSLKSEIELGEKIFKLFSEVARIFSSNGEQALIFIYIDDVDINKNRCSEAIKIILRYLKHPNVVVFISGDINRMERVLVTDQIMRQGAARAREIVSVEEVARDINIYTYELLKKVLPYSNRYKLVNLSNRDKKVFRYPSLQHNNQVDNNETFEDIIKKMFRGEEISDSVYCIFDYKPRGIVILWDYIRNNFNNSQYGKRNYYENLLEVILSTNEKLSGYNKLLREQFISIIEEKSGNVIIDINYDKFINYVIKTLNEEHTSDKKLVKQQDYIMIVHLFYFLDKLISFKNIDGYAYTEMLNTILEKRIYFKIRKVEHILMMYSKLSQRLQLDHQIHIFERKKYFDIYKELILDSDENLKGEIERDGEWQSNYERANKMYGENYKQVLEELLAVFDGIPYNQDLLGEEHTIDELWIGGSNGDNDTRRK